MNYQAMTAARRALDGLFYEQDGQWFTGRHGDANVTADLAPVLAALGLPHTYPPGRDELEQAEMLALDHSPLIAPVRKGHNGEKAYAAMWEATMATHDEDAGCLPIERVLRNMGGPITQRQASVLASVAMWFGTACGGAMLKHAERLREAHGIHSYDTYLVAWTLENQRSYAKNHGVRTVEYLMAPASSWRHSPFGGCPLSEIPEVSAEDLETIEHFMRWLAEGEGQQFLARAKLMDEQHCKEDAIMRRAEQNLAKAVAQ